MNLDPYGLQAYHSKTWSQFGEDGITRELIRRLDPPKTFIEIGAGHNGENCTHVLADEGWRGYWIEGDPRHARLLGEVSVKDNVTILSLRVTVENVGILRGAKLLFENMLGVLSIDIDGNDYWIWKTVCAEADLRPWVCIIEFNPHVPTDMPYIMPYRADYEWDHHSYDGGASLQSMIELGEQLGYHFLGTESATPSLDSPNAFFVRADLRERAIHA